jgi:hypothetical protein
MASVALVTSSMSPGWYTYDRMAGASAPNKSPLPPPPPSGFKLLKPAKNKFTWSDFTNFSKQVSKGSHNLCFLSFHLLHFQNLLKCCRHKNDQSISRIFIKYFGGFLKFGPTVRSSSNKQKQHHHTNSTGSPLVGCSSVSHIGPIPKQLPPQPRRRRPRHAQLPGTA